MKAPPEIIAQIILHGATKVSSTDDAHRTKRIAIALLYRRFRQARKMTNMASRRAAKLGGQAEYVQCCIAAEIEAWNSLQVMKATLFAQGN